MPLSHFLIDFSYIFSESLHCFNAYWLLLNIHEIKRLKYLMIVSETLDCFFYDCHLHLPMLPLTFYFLSFPSCSSVCRNLGWLIFCSVLNIKDREILSTTNGDVICSFLSKNSLGKQLISSFLKIDASYRSIIFNHSYHVTVNFLY